MEQLSFPAYSFKIKNIDGSSESSGHLIFDVLRKKYLKLTPEEWVRQHVVHFLIELGYPQSWIQLEREISVYQRKKRFDVMITSAQGTPILLVECKAPNVKLNQETFDQISRYNSVINAPMLLITNGLNHFCLQQKEHKYTFLSTLPSYQQHLSECS